MLLARRAIMVYSIRTMKKHPAVFYNTLLAVGILSIISGFLLFVSSVETSDNLRSFLVPMLLIVCGAVFLYFTMCFTNSTFHLFLGMELCFAGVFSMLVVQHILPLSLREWWPIFVVFSGFAFFFAGLYRHRRMLAAYTLPSVLLIVLGLLFLLFSFHAVTISFRSFVAIFGPFVLIAGGVTLVILFQIQRKNSGFSIPDEADEIESENGAFRDPGDGR